MSKRKAPPPQREVAPARPPPRPASGALKAAIVISVIAVVVVAGLFATGVIHRLVAGNLCTAYSGVDSDPAALGPGEPAALAPLPAQQPRSPEASYSLGLSSPSPSQPASGVHWDSISLHPSSGVSTSMFGLELVTTDRIVLGGGVAPASCGPTNVLTASAYGAPASGSWYAVLTYGANRTVASVYSGEVWESAAVGLTSSMQLVLVSGSTSYAGSGDTFSAYATGSASVSGSVVL